MQVIMIAHNQLDLVKLGIESLRIFGKIGKQDIVVVDNASDDRLREWLETQQDLNYLICDAGVESYAVILNTAIREFGLTEDILVLSPSYTVLEGTIDEMRQVLYSDEHIGAVSGCMICLGMMGVHDFLSALEISKRMAKKKEPNKQKLCLWEDAVLLKKSMIKELGQFDEQLIVPYNVMMDYWLRAICNGYQLFECADAYFYYIDDSNDIYREMKAAVGDSAVLKEKWRMNYFNDCANQELVMCIQADKEEELDVLEIGCDCGANLLEVKKQYPNARVYGVELNAKAAEIAAQIAAVQVGNIEDRQIAFENRKFDYIMFGDVLEHLRSPAGTISYCKELLKENGRIIACIPNLMHHSVMRQLLDGKFTYTDMGLLDCTHIHFFTYKEILHMFCSEGFVVEQISSVKRIQAEEDEETKEFVRALTALSSETQEFMYYAYQYLVSARVKK